MELIDSCLVTLVSVPSGVAVILLYRRARFKFFLDKKDRFAAAKHIGVGVAGDVGYGARLSEIVKDVDTRNESFLYSRKGSVTSNGGNANPSSTEFGRNSERRTSEGYNRRRSVSWDASQSIAATASLSSFNSASASSNFIGPSNNPLTQEERQSPFGGNKGSRVNNKWSFFKKSNHEELNPVKTKTGAFM